MIRDIEEGSEATILWEIGRKGKPLELSRLKVQVLLLADGQEPQEIGFTAKGNKLTAKTASLARGRYTLYMTIDRDLSTETFSYYLDAFQIVPRGSEKCTSSLRLKSKIIV